MLLSLSFPFFWCSTLPIDRICALPTGGWDTEGSLWITGREFFFFEGISIHENWVILHTRGWKVEGGGWRCEVKMEDGRWGILIEDGKSLDGRWKRMEGEESPLRTERVEIGRWRCRMRTKDGDGRWKRMEGEESPFRTERAEMEGEGVGWG